MKAKLPPDANEKVMNGKLDAKANYILDHLESLCDAKGEIHSLLNQTIQLRSEKRIREIFRKLNDIGMIEGLQAITQSLILKVIISALLDFDKKNGHFPEMNEDASVEEFTLAAWAFFFMAGPNPFAPLSFCHMAPIIKE